ncbi:hypothetical protein TWF718_010449 [Orbilia javanica]|uniref:gamma-glutamylcyclotransferase n=1 Tax=Orbilia javanica TaxID=47235 RepID=A0AAN8RE26_9PEZI
MDVFERVLRPFFAPQRTARAAPRPTPRPAAPSHQRQTAAGETLYFAYGSNLSFEQMARRCPQSRYIGRARLHGYKFQINERGYANVVKVRHQQPESFVEGLCYRLHPEDEARLDRAEGVPTAYSKKTKRIKFFPAQASLLGRTVADLVQNPAQTSPTAQEDRDNRGETTIALVYLSTKYVKPSLPWHEYILRIEEGIHQALQLGISPDYIKNDVRPCLKTGRGDRENTGPNRDAGASSPNRRSRRDSRPHGGSAQRRAPRRPREVRP